MFMSALYPYEFGCTPRLAMVSIALRNPSILEPHGQGAYPSRIPLTAAKNSVNLSGYPNGALRRSDFSDLNSSSS